MRLGAILWCVLVALTGFVMFKVKYEVMALEDELARVNHQILADQDSIHVLKAEWSYLSQPDRLGELSRKYLGLAPIATAQLRPIESIPFRPSALPPGPESPNGLAPTPNAPAVAQAGPKQPTHAAVAPKAKPAPQTVASSGMTTLAAVGKSRSER